jgi:DNA-binding MarR family transcriptional regulator
VGDGAEVTVAGSRATAADDIGDESAVRELTQALIRLVQASRRSGTRLQRSMPDVTVPQLAILLAVQAAGDQGVGAIATAAGLAQPTVTRSLGGLERGGLISRRPADRDRRGTTVGLTTHGRKLLREKQDEIADRMVVLWSELSNAERELAVPLLERLADILDRLV